jgi:hypothetical protein
VDPNLERHRDATCEKTAFLSHLYIKKRKNCQDRLGTNIGKLKNDAVFSGARIILPLAFLVRANDTALHRQWLRTAVDGFLTRKHCEGTWCAFKEELSHPGNKPQPAAATDLATR